MGEFFGYLLAGMLFSAPSGTEDSVGMILAQHFEVSPPAVRLPDFHPLINAEAALIVDRTSGEIIWGKNALEKRAMASLTKLMTALLILENHDLNEVVTVPRSATQLEGTKMRLVSGEKITVANLLKGLLIPSGNDAALALAEFHSGSEGEFIKAMNRRAVLLGMDSTHFLNPHGLDQEGHFSTAHDLAILARKVLDFPEVRSSMNTRQLTVSSVDGTFSHELNSTNDLLGSPFPVSGLKTGTTDEAGECLITIFTSGNREMVMIILGSKDRFQDVKALFPPFL